MSHTRKLPNEVSAPASANPPLSDASLVEMTEHLIAAHIAARRNGDCYAREMIEVVLRHAGARLANEFPDHSARRADVASSIDFARLSGQSGRG